MDAVKPSETVSTDGEYKGGILSGQEALLELEDRAKFHEEVTDKIAEIHLQKKVGRVHASFIPAAQESHSIDGYHCRRVRQCQ